MKKTRYATMLFCPRNERTWSLDTAYVTSPIIRRVALMVAGDPETETVIGIHTSERKHTIEAVIEFLDGLVTKHGRPDTIVTDISDLIQSKTLTRWCDDLGICLRFSANTPEKKAKTNVIFGAAASRVLSLRNATNQ